MRLLFVIEKLNAGGRERRFVEIIKGILTYYPHIEFHVVVYEMEIVFKDLLEYKVYFHYLKITNNYNLLLKYYSFIRIINPDIVQCWTIKTSAYFSILKPFFNYKLIASYVSDTFGFRNYKLKLQGKYIALIADLIIGNSVAGLKSYCIPKKKSLVIYNGYDLSRLTLGPKIYDKKKSLEIETPYTVVMVATVSIYKDYETFLEVARRVIDKRKDVTFLSLGGGKYLDKYRILLKENEKKYIKFLGHRDDVDSIVSISNIGLLCSFSEGVSNSILEYMMHKKPVIASGSGGTNEIVQDNISGYILPTSSPNLVFLKIMELLDDRLKREQMGQAGYQIAIEKFSLEKNTNMYYQKYKDLIAK
jgi:glycosyltransferase involved in cell wall biosynthesis